MSKRIFAGTARGALAATCIFLLSLGKPAAAQQIPALATLSDKVAAAHPELVRWRATLEEERNGLRGRTQRHNAQCRAVEEGSDAEARCRSELDVLSSDVGAHIARSNQFNTAVASAEAETAGNMPTTYLRIKAAANVRGTVYWLTSDGRKVPITAGGPLYIGARIVTGDDGHLQVLLLDETVFTLGPNSDMVLDVFVYDPDTSVEKISARVMKGVFRWVTGKVARKDPASMKVTLPVGTIGIRGTDFEATVEADGSGVVKLASGQLQITENKTGRVFLLNAGETVTFGSDGIFSLPKKSQ
jgi:hypothetical protein